MDKTSKTLGRILENFQAQWVDKNILWMGQETSKVVISEIPLVVSVSSEITKMLTMCISNFELLPSRVKLFIAQKLQSSMYDNSV